MAQNSIESLLEEKRIFDPPREFSNKAYIKSFEEYKQIYERSISDPESFWTQQAQQLEWFKKWDKVHYWDAQKAICRWFEGGKLNASVNCLDRHLETHGDRIAIKWEGDGSEIQSFTYKQLHLDVCKFANVLKGKGVKKGDRVAIYLPMIPQLVISMLSCTRIGAIHNVVFGGFSADSLSDRINDSACSFVITADAGLRGGKKVLLKANVDRALDRIDKKNVNTVIVFNRAGTDVNMKPGRDIWWHEEIKNAST